MISLAFYTQLWILENSSKLRLTLLIRISAIIQSKNPDQRRAYNRSGQLQRASSHTNPEEAVSIRQDRRLLHPPAVLRYLQGVQFFDDHVWRKVAFSWDFGGVQSCIWKVGLSFLDLPPSSRFKSLLDKLNNNLMINYLTSVSIIIYCFLNILNIALPDNFCTSISFIWNKCKIN